MPDKSALSTGQAEPAEITASVDTADCSDWPASAEQIAAVTPGELARLTGQDGAFKLRSRAFRQSASTTSALLKAALNALADEVMRVSSRGRPNPKLAENIRLIALNLYSAYRQDERLCTALPMATPWYSAKAPRNPVLSFRLTVEQAWQGLVTLGLAEVVRKGSPWRGTGTLVRAMPTLAEYLERGASGAPFNALRMALVHDPIILKRARPKAKGAADEPAGGTDRDDSKERPLLFAETPETERMRAAVVRINTVNTPDRIQLPAFANNDREALFDALRGEEHATWRPTCPTALEGWFAETALRRIFKRGSFDLGGRFYGAAWQQMPKVWRRRIVIGGEPVVELHYGSLHPRMTHHLYEHVEAPKDCYVGINAPRDLVKRAVSALLNMENGTSHAPAWFRVEEAGMRWASFREVIATGLPQIASRFGTGIGHKLQRVDSDIAERVMLHFAEQDIPCLGVHGSFIVAERHSAELGTVMREVYRDRIGFEPVIKAG